MKIYSLAKAGCQFLALDRFSSPQEKKTSAEITSDHKAQNMITIDQFTTICPLIIIRGLTQ